MNIHFIPKFTSARLNEAPNSTIRRSNQSGLNANNPSSQNLRPLAKDTVSFSGTPASKLQTTMKDALEHCYLSSEGNLRSRAKVFHRAAKNVCEKLADDGFSYDPIYNAKHPVKTLDAFMDKYLRHGKVQDTVRGTVYWKHQHDIPAFKKFIDGMSDEGYVIQPLKVLNQETIKYENIPDLEIRQKGISRDDLSILGDFLQKAEISEPRSSTYSDFQMRFVPKANKRSQPIELLMIYGPHYAGAKELESKYVYNIARSFDRLHINLKADYPDKSPAKRIANNIDVIKTRLREDISRPLFTNAYNADLNIRGEEKQPVVISKVHCKVLEGYMSGIKQKLPLFYKEFKKQLNNDEYIINVIKNSADYISRSDKEISKAEIKEMRNFLKSRVSIHEAEDMGTITTAQEMLKETIKKFGEK